MNHLKPVSYRRVRDVRNSQFPIWAKVKVDLGLSKTAIFTEDGAAQGARTGANSAGPR